MTSKLRRILIVDDDQDTLANLSDILSGAGYETDVAVDGDSALAKISQLDSDDQCQFDLCLMDFKMPGMDGDELYRRILDFAPDLQTIMITAFRGVEDTERALSAGTWKVLHKPVDIELLLRLIRGSFAP